MGFTAGLGFAVGGRPGRALSGGSTRPRCSTSSRSGGPGSSSACRPCTACSLEAGAEAAGSPQRPPLAVRGRRDAARAGRGVPGHGIRRRPARRRPGRAGRVRRGLRPGRVGGSGGHEGPPPVPRPGRARRACPAMPSGVPLPGVRFRIRDGELEAEGPGVTSGYWGDAAATRGSADRRRVAAHRRPRRARPARHGPLPGPGQGRDQGRAATRSTPWRWRRRWPSIPAIAEAAVLALPDERLGEVPVAAVRLAPGSKSAHADAADELLAGPPETWRPTSARAASWWSTSCPARVPARSRRTVCGPCSRDPGHD